MVKSFKMRVLALIACFSMLFLYGCMADSGSGASSSGRSGGAAIDKQLIIEGPLPEKIGGSSTISFSPAAPLRAADFGKTGAYSIMVCDRNDFSAEVSSMEVVDNIYRATINLTDKSFIPVLKIVEKASGNAIIMAVPGRVPRYSELPPSVRRIIIKGYLLDSESTARALMLLESPADPKIPIITLTEEETRLEVVTRVLTKVKTGMDTVIENISDGVTTIIEIAKTVTTINSIILSPETPQKIKNALIRVIKNKPLASDTIVSFIQIIKNPDPFVQKVITINGLPVSMNITSGNPVTSTTDTASVKPAIGAIVNNPMKYTPPVLTGVTVSPSVVRPGGTISLTFTSDKPLFMAPVVTIFGSGAAVTQIAQTIYVAVLKTQPGAAPASGFVIDGIYDIYGNQAEAVTITTDGSVPVLSSGSNMAEAPKIVPDGGIYNDTVTVSLSSKTAGAAVIFTTGGEAPTAFNSTVYSGPFDIGVNTTVKAVAYAEGLETSGVMVAQFTVIRDAQKTAAPAAAPIPGTYSDAQLVVLSSATAGAAIIYTLDGSQPSLTNGAKYTNPISVMATANIRAIAVKEGMANSAVSLLRYVIVYQSSKSYGLKAVQRRKGVINLAAEKPGAKIYYTLDGSEPTSVNGILYNGGEITIENEGMLKAVAVYEQQKIGELSVPVVNGVEALNASLAAGNTSVIALPGSSYNGQDISAATILNITPAVPGSTGGSAEASSYDQIKLAVAVAGVKTISVAAGDYSAEGPLVFNRAGLTIEGAGGSTVVGGLKIVSDDVIVRNLVVKGFSGEKRDGFESAVFSAAKDTVLDNVVVSAESKGENAVGVLFSGEGQIVKNSTLHVIAPDGVKVIQAELSGENKTFTANVIYSGGVLVDPASTYTADSKSNTFIGGLSGWIIADSYTESGTVSEEKIEQIYGMGDYTKLEPGAVAVVSEDPSATGRTAGGENLIFASIADNGSLPERIKIKFSARTGAIEVKAQYSTDGAAWTDDAALITGASVTADLGFKAARNTVYYIRLKVAGGQYAGVSEVITIKTPDAARTETPAAACDDASGAVRLYIASGDDAASIYYTLDGSVPDTAKESQLYKTPIVDLSGVKYIKAAARKEGLSASAVFVLPVASSPAELDSFLDAGYELVAVSGGNYFGDYMCELNAMVGPVSGFGAGKSAPASSCNALKAALSSSRIAVIKTGACNFSNIGPLLIKRPVTLAGAAGQTVIGGLNISSANVSVRNLTVSGLSGRVAGGVECAVYSASTGTVLDGVAVEYAASGADSTALYMTGDAQKVTNCVISAPVPSGSNSHSAGVFGGSDKTVANNTFKSGGVSIESGASFSAASSANRFSAGGRAWVVRAAYFDGVSAVLAAVEKIYAMGDYSAMANSDIAVFSEKIGANKDGSKFAFVNIADDGSYSSGLAVKFNPVAFASKLAAQYSSDGASWTEDAAAIDADTVSAQLKFKPAPGAYYYLRLKITDKEGVTAVSESVKVRATVRRPLEIVSIVSGSKNAVSFSFNLPLYDAAKKPLAANFDHTAILGAEGVRITSAHYDAANRVVRLELSGAAQGSSLSFMAGVLFNEDGSMLENTSYYLHGWNDKWSGSADVTAPAKPVEIEPMISATTQAFDFKIKVRTTPGCDVYARFNGADALDEASGGKAVADAAGGAVLSVAIMKLGADGTKSVEITAVDGARNASERLIVAFTKFSAAPNAPVEVAAAAKNGTTQLGDFTISVTAANELAITASVGGTNVLKGVTSVAVSGGTASLPIDFGALGANGNKSIEIIAKNFVGNVSVPLIVAVVKSVPQQVVVVPVPKDETPPAKPAETGSPLVHNSYQKADFDIAVSAETGSKVTAEDANGANLLRDGKSFVTAENGGAVLPVRISAFQDQGANTIRIKATDQAANASEVLEITVKKDTVKPSVVETDLNNKKDGTSQTADFTIAVTTEKSATLTAKIGGNAIAIGDAGAMSVAAGDQDGTATLKIAIAALTDNGQPTAISIYAKDLAGNDSEAPLAVNVTRAAANTKPGTPVLAVPIFDQTITYRSNPAVKIKVVDASNNGVTGLTPLAKIGANSVLTGFADNGDGTYTLNIDIFATGFAEGDNAVAIKVKNAEQTESDPLNIIVKRDTKVAIAEAAGAAVHNTVKTADFNIKVIPTPAEAGLTFTASITSGGTQKNVLRPAPASVTYNAGDGSYTLPIAIAAEGFAEGSNVIVITPTSSHNVASNALNVTVTKDTVVALSEITSPAVNNSSQTANFTIKVKTDPNATVSASIGGNPLVVGAANATTVTAAGAIDGEAVLKSADLLIGIDTLTADGEFKTIVVKSTDANSHEATVNILVKRPAASDTTPPVTPIEDISVLPKEGTTQSSDFYIVVRTEAQAVLTATVSAANVLGGASSVTAGNDGIANLPISFTALGEAGMKNISIAAKDAANNASQPLVVKVTKAAAPVAPATPEDVSEPLVDGSSKRADFTLTAATSAGAQVTAKLGATTLATQTADAVTGKVSLPIAVAALANGVNAIDLSATKDALNSGVSQITVKVDTLAPAAPVLIEPAQNSIQASNFIVTVQSEAKALISAKIQGTETNVLLNSVSSVTADSEGNAKLPVNISVLGNDGAVNIAVTAVDAAGNAQTDGPLVVAVNKNTTPPTTPVETTNPSAAGSYKKADFDISVTAKANSLITATVNNSSVLIDAGGSSADNAVAIGGAAALKIGINKLAEGANAIAIKSSDAAGTSGTLTINVTKDTLAPLKPSVDESSLAYEGATVSSSFDIIVAAETGATVKAEVRKGDGTFVNNSTPVTAAGGKATLAINALNAGANPKIVITATDAAANVSAALTVNVVRDLTPAIPVEVAPSKNGTYQTADFSITVNIEAGSTIFAKKGSTAGTSVLTAGESVAVDDNTTQKVLAIGLNLIDAGNNDIYIYCQKNGLTSKSLIVRILKATSFAISESPVTDLTGAQTVNFSINILTKAGAGVTARLNGVSVLTNNAVSMTADSNGKAALAIDHAKIYNNVAGTKMLDIVATDPAGNTATLNPQKSVNVGSPATTGYITEAAGSVKNNTIQSSDFAVNTVLGSAADKNVAAKLIESDTVIAGPFGIGGGNPKTATVNITIASLNFGLNTIRIYSTDASPSILPLTIQVTRPNTGNKTATPVLVEKFDSTYEWKSDFNIKVSAAPGSTVTAKIGANSVLQNNAASVTADSTTGLAVLPVAFSALADGSNTLNICALDSVGGNTVVSDPLAVAATKYVPGAAPPAAVPAAPVEGIPSVNNTKQRVGFSINVVSLKNMKITAAAGDPAASVITGAGTELTVTNDNGQLAIPVDITKLGADGVKTITIKSKDANGTVSTDALTITVTKATAPPAAPTVPVPPASPQTLGFDINAKAAAGVRLTAKIGETNALRDVSFVVADANGDAKLPVDITMLASGNNDISLKASDEVGNESSATVVSVSRTVIPGFVTGIVLDAETDAGIGGAAVTIKNSGGVTVSTGSTDAGGGYKVETAFGYNYTMEVAKAGTTTSTYYDVKVDDSNVYLETIPHVTADPNDFTGANTGMIIDATNGKAVPGAIINLRPGINNKKGVIKMSMLSNSSGMYSFSGTNPGNYTIEVIKSGFETSYFAVPHVGKSRTITRDCEIVPVMAPGQARIVLTWKAHPPDLDGHLAVPAGAGKYHIYTRTPAYIVSGVTKAKLEYDDTNGYGPETMLISVPEAGTYRFWVGRQSPGGSPLGALGMQVKLYVSTAGGLITRTITAPNADGTVWKAFEMNGGYITPVNSIVNMSKTDLDIMIKQ